MFPTAMITALYPTIKLGTSHAADAVNESTSAFLSSAKLAGEALCSLDEDTLKWVVETDQGALAIGSKFAHLMTDKGVQSKELPEADADTDTGVADDSVKQAFKGRAVSDETFRRVMKLAALKGVQTNVEVEGSDVMVRYTTENGLVVGVVEKKKGRDQRFLIPVRESALVEASVLIPAVKANLQKALASSKDEDTKGFIKKALATLNAMGIAAQRSKDKEGVDEAIGYTKEGSLHQLKRISPRVDRIKKSLETAEGAEKQRLQRLLDSTLAEIAEIKAYLKEMGNDDFIKLKEAAFIFMDETGLSLREGKNGKGELVAHVECDLEDPQAVAEAKEKLDAEAEALGYTFVNEDVALAEGKAKDEDTEDSDEDEDESEDEEEEDSEDDDEEDMDEAIRSIAAHLVVEAGVPLTATEVIETALEDGALEVAFEAVEDLAVRYDQAELVEGLKARMHTRGRKPMLRSGRAAPAIKVKNLRANPMAEGTAASSASATVPGQTRAATIVTVTGAADEMLDDVVALGRDNDGQGFVEGSTVEVHFLVPERADAFIENLSVIPGAKGTKRSQVADANESVADYTARVVAMPLEKFVAHIDEAVALESPEVFSIRVAAITEAFKIGSKKDMSRKITAVNPKIKKKMGKGIDIEGLKEAETKITVQADRIDEFIAVATRCGTGTQAAITINGDRSLTTTLSESLAAKIRDHMGVEGMSFSPV